MSNTDRSIVVRFPPSPTGEIHIGNVRTLLFNYLFARQMGGRIVFRFEDTDKERSKREYEQPMLDALHNLGLSWDEGPFRQSERTDIYEKYLRLLVENNLAYEDAINKEGTGKIIRLRNEEKEISWNDLVKGEIKINTHTFKERDVEGNYTEDNNADIIIARSFNDPIYHFTVVVDDWLMGVTHVIRGDDHITSTPRQIMIMEALQKLPHLAQHPEKEGGSFDFANIGDEPPVVIPHYAHLPTIIGEDRKKLSKRNGTTSLKDFFGRGYLKETMVNYLALLGWNPGDEREFFTLEELVKEFSLKRVQVSPAQFDFKKLDHINKHYLDKLSEDDFVSGVYDAYPTDCREGIDADKNKFRKIVLKVYRDRISKFREVYEMSQAGESNAYHSFSWDSDFASFDIQKIAFKNQTIEEAKKSLENVKDKIENISETDWNDLNLKNLLWDWSATQGRGQVLHPLRTLLSLKDKSPDPFIIMDIIGKEETLRRFAKILS